MRWNAPPTPGALARTGLFCPGPSSLNRPHPPHSQAHHDFTARRLIRDAFAVRERLGDPRVVPSFRCTFLPDMPSSLTPGSSIIVTCPVSRCRRGLRRELTGSTLPTLPQSDSRGRPISWLHWFTTATACQIACPPGRIRLDYPSHRGLLLPGFRQFGHPPRRWISLRHGLDSFCRRDFHPLEWQLASLR